MLVDKDGYAQDGCYWYHPDWIAIVTEQENLEYTEKACERFLEIHPDNKYRELIAYMLDFAKKEINAQGLSEQKFGNE